MMKSSQQDLTTIKRYLRIFQTRYSAWVTNYIVQQKKFSSWSCIRKLRISQQFRGSTLLLEKILAVDVSLFSSLLSVKVDKFSFYAVLPYLIPWRNLPCLTWAQSRLLEWSCCHVNPLSLVVLYFVTGAVLVIVGRPTKVRSANCGLCSDCSFKSG